MNDDHDSWVDEADFEFLERMDDLVEEIETRQDLSNFIFQLVWGYKDGNFEPQPVTEYLHGTGALTDALDSWYRNNEINEDPETPTWKMFGRILLAAFDHS